MGNQHALTLECAQVQLRFYLILLPSIILERNDQSVLIIWRNVSAHLFLYNNLTLCGNVTLTHMTLWRYVNDIYTEFIFKWYNRRYEYIVFLECVGSGVLWNYLNTKYLQAENHTTCARACQTLESFHVASNLQTKLPMKYFQWKFCYCKTCLLLYSKREPRKGIAVRVLYTHRSIHSKCKHRRDLRKSRLAKECACLKRITW